jgi:Peptidase family M28
MTTPHDAPLDRPAAPSIRVVLPILLGWIALCTIGWRNLAVAPDAPGDTGFSEPAGRATLTHLLEENAPHPVGSALHAVVRDRIVAILREAGYEPAVDAAFQCTPRFGCAFVQNITATRRGTDSSRAVMVSAHYDSVPAGPGASDDGAGTAIILELAKAIAKGPQPRNDIVFHISDGEELGLFGAHAFLERDPAMKRIPVMVNLEARGAGGPSVMFETGDGNLELMKLYGQSVKRPVANSLAFEIYKRLPNGTDFTIYRNSGVIGFNLAFIGKASLYHTPLDNVANLDKATFQHHGDNAFALVNALAFSDLASLTSANADASYFDLFSYYLVQWPAMWNLPAAIAALLIPLLLMILRRRELGGAGRTVGWFLITLVVPLVLLGGAGHGLAYPLGHWPGALQLDHPMPWPGRAALLFTAMFIAVLVGAVIGRRNAMPAATWAVWILMGALSMFLAATVPGAAYTVLIPAAGFAIAALASLLSGHRNALFWAALVGFVLTAFFWTGLLVMFESTLGFPQSMAKLLALAPLTWAALPVIAHCFSGPGSRAGLPILLTAAGAIAAAAAAALVPAVTPEVPRGLNFMYQDDGAAAGPRWLTDSIPDKWDAPLTAAGFPLEEQPFYHLGFRAAAARAKPAIDLKLPPPTFAPSAESAAAAPASGGNRIISGTLRLPPQSLAGGLTIGPNSGLLGLRIDGKQVWSEADLKNGLPRSARLAGVSGKDLAVELTLAPGAKGPIIIYQRMPLPDSAELTTLRTHRPVDAAPFGFGDCGLVLRRIQI